MTRWVYLAQVEHEPGTWQTMVAADDEQHAMDAALELLRVIVTDPQQPGSRVRLGKVPMDDPEAEPEVLWTGG